MITARDKGSQATSRDRDQQFLKGSGTKLFHFCGINDQNLSRLLESRIRNLGLYGRSVDVLHYKNSFCVVVRTNTRAIDCERSLILATPAKYTLALTRKWAPTRRRGRRRGPISRARVYLAGIVKNSGILAVYEGVKLKPENTITFAFLKCFTMIMLARNPKQYVGLATRRLEEIFPRVKSSRPSRICCQKRPGRLNL